MVKAVFVSLLSLLFGCNYSAATRAWEQESAANGWSRDDLHRLRLGDEVHYECGCKWRVHAIGGVFGARPLPPPKLCLRHDTPIVSVKHVADVKFEDDTTPAPE
jgi:hypothetical protein